MSHAYAIEVAGQVVGIVAADTRGFRFHAALPQFEVLDGRLFRSPGQAERTARTVDQSTSRKRISRSIS